MNPASTASLPELSRISPPDYREYSWRTLELQHAARRNRAMVLGRLAAWVVDRALRRLAALRPAPRSLSQTLAHWG